MKTSTAEAYNYICPDPECGDNLTKDRIAKGYVRHMNNPNCKFEKGEKDQ